MPPRKNQLEDLAAQNLGRLKVEVFNPKLKQEFFGAEKLPVGIGHEVRFRILLTSTVCFHYTKEQIKLSNRHQRLITEGIESKEPEAGAQIKSEHIKKGSRTIAEQQAKYVSDLSCLEVEYHRMSAEPQLTSLLGKVGSTEKWYAIYTKARHEKVVLKLLLEKGFEVFLPLKSARRPISGWRYADVQLPLFPGYLFSRFSLDSNTYHKLKSTFGVVGMVSFGGKPSSIPEEQIDIVRKVLTSELSYREVPFVTIGQTVKIQSGFLKGFCGRVTHRKNKSVMILSLDSLHKSLEVEIKGFLLETQLH
ncbi:MAG: hypothetical protein M3410_15290 [Acidobacteriota bacterium]|nr:hypothetical protein [Acidobacteriota bacterium]